MRKLWLRELGNLNFSLPWFLVPDTTSGAMHGGAACRLSRWMSGCCPAHPRRTQRKVRYTPQQSHLRPAPRAHGQQHGVSPACQPGPVTRTGCCSPGSRPAHWTEHSFTDTRSRASGVCLTCCSSHTRCAFLLAPNWPPLPLPCPGTRTLRPALIQPQEPLCSGCQLLPWLLGCPLQCGRKRGWGTCH